MQNLNIPNKEKIKALTLISEAEKHEMAGNYKESINCLKEAYKLCPSLEFEGLDDEWHPHECLNPSRMPPFSHLSFSFSHLTGQPEVVRQYFEENGYFVITDALQPEEISVAYNYFTQFMSSQGIDVLGASSCSSFGDPSVGIVGISGCGHSAMNWYIRSRPTVKKIFRFLHHLEDHQKMITSFDGFNWFRNPEMNFKYQGNTSPWFHVDAGVWAAGEYVQGLVNLIDCTDPMDAGLVLLPKSHKTIFQKIVPEISTSQNFSGITYIGHYESQVINQINPEERSFRVPLPAGALVCWKSSVLHCNMGCQIRASPNPLQVVRRLAIYISMMPDLGEEEVTKQRRKLFHLGGTTGHNPYQCSWGGDRPTQEAVKKKVVLIEEEDLPEGALELL